ncbi:hypothetical protein RRG08_012120 [Elysia crispata]|uniref:Uncharacterized protein n=1 Tax=Elysia crispata TaxID=231223 RepID=A0AAE0ZPK6_9GAST|nr:hypothetical protein RRG08_012120 [Elysia crispata]
MQDRPGSDVIPEMLSFLSDLNNSEHDESERINEDLDPSSPSGWVGDRQGVARTADPKRPIDTSESTSKDCSSN